MLRKYQTGSNAVLIFANGHVTDSKILIFRISGF